MHSATSSAADTDIQAATFPAVHQLSLHMLQGIPLLATVAVHFLILMHLLSCPKFPKTVMGGFRYTTQGVPGSFPDQIWNHMSCAVINNFTSVETQTLGM
jgi:hypothetical protein